MKWALLVLFATSICEAKQLYLTAMKSEFPEARLTQRCTLCHSSSGLRLGPFGTDFSELKKEHGYLQMKKVWRDIRPLDSDADGVSNEDEIAAGTNPNVAD